MSTIKKLVASLDSRKVQEAFWELNCLVGFVILMFGVYGVIPKAVPIILGAIIIWFAMYRYAALRKKE